MLCSFFDFLSHMDRKAAPSAIPIGGNWAYQEWSKSGIQPDIAEWVTMTW